ncbi:hypothetical protein ACIG0D_27505 [Streptomyces sp. NPDC052773]|uniref:hypothetical protein n=1 Tax=Streptomyces sp. NPDC052773 TaxID=3365693 RepID=UPI0037CDDC8B
MTTAKPLPPHGTTARAYGSPGRRARCNCQPCRTARNRHQKQLRVNRELGRSPFTSPAAAQAHLIELHRTMSWDTLTAATGVHFSNLVAIYHGARKKIRHETEAKILAVKAPTKGAGGQYIDVTGSMRRLQALSWLGHSYATLASAAGTEPNRIMSIVNGRQPTIRRALADRIAAIYPQLVTSPPPSNKFTTRTRNVARAKGWHGPLAWDAIDDPNCEPETEGCIDYQRRQKAAIDLELVVRRTSQGATAEEIAREIGCHKRSVVRARRRAELAVAA